VVFSAIGGSRVGRGVGVGALDAAVLPEVGVGVALGAAVVALGAAVVAIAAAVGEGEGPAAEPHDMIRITPAARIANRAVSNRTPIVVPPTSRAAEDNGWRTADDSRIRRGRPVAREACTDHPGRTRDHGPLTKAALSTSGRSRGGESDHVTDVLALI
jgi:hypothetical protein